METTRYRIEGLDCADCAATLEKAIAARPEVDTARLTFATSQLVVSATDVSALDPLVRDLTKSMGFAVATDESSKDQPGGWRGWWNGNRHIALTVAVGVLVVIAVALGLSGAPRALSVAVYVTAIVAGLIPVARAGWSALRNAKTVDMNVLMTIAAVGAIAVGEYIEGAVTVFLFSIGELLERFSADRARRAIGELMELAPDEAIRIRDGEEQRLPVSALEVGDCIVVRPGDRIAMDGRVVEGASSVNQASITGESAPVTRGVGGSVFAGTMNGQGALIVEVTHLASESTIARVMHLVEDALETRAPSQRFVDRFARVYTPSVLALAGLLAVLPPLLGLGSLNEWVYRALVLLVIACPCALVISTPVTIVSALARAARSGVLIKGGRHLEELGALKALAFDKTGTLTQGTPLVVGGFCSPTAGSLVSVDLEGSGSDGHCENCEDLLAKASALEARSEHVLAQAILQYAKDHGVRDRYEPGTDVRAHPGMGIEGSVAGHNVSVGSHAFSHRNGAATGVLCEAIEDAESSGYSVVVISDDCCDRQCYVTVTDALRHNAAHTVEALSRIGIDHVAMLTGDSRDVAERIGAEVGVDQVYAELLPEVKMGLIEELHERYGSVGMVGDGVNDAPAMTKASLGIAMGAAGTDAALETADVVLMSDDLSRIPWAIRLGRKARQVIGANIAFSLALKAVFLGLAVAGYSTLWMAIVADTGASLLLSLNGLRMLGFREDDAGA